MKKVMWCNIILHLLTSIGIYDDRVRNHSLTRKRKAEALKHGAKPD